MFRCQLSRHFLRPTSATNFRTSSFHPRCLSTTPATCFPRKNTQDKDSIDTSSNEYSKSGSDDAAASSNAAFDSSKTSPESAEKTAEHEQGASNSLNVSPGNPDVSKPRGAQEGGSQGSPKTGSDTGKGSAPKSGGDKSG
ncbi:hypothetical protein CC80DRAFT_166315 [Byssothecium circinans]|uniref:Uncharacterized protein n=1 Tax=Byssothecium circinans TaxID=147558 RepID=A0A6A5TMD0_9PLEO|nr:hypothetical protein CC80DRAFT_166315 [Byssothecium circinans]